MPGIIATRTVDRFVPRDGGTSSALSPWPGMVKA
jgi:hypothetical protein